MMKPIRNREDMLLLTVFAALGLTASAVCLFWDFRGAIVCAVLCLSVMCAYIIAAKRRGDRIERLTSAIDRMILDAESIDLSEYAEGELSILKNELDKLANALRGKASDLRRERTLLADSIADISHQIRTPLTAMNLICAELSAPDTGEAKRLELTRELHSQLSRIDRLVAALLKLARLDADAVRMEPVKIELSALIADALSPIAIQMELKGQEAEITASGSALCDPSWTAEALTNIFKNCSEHMGEGKLHITAAENPLYSEITVRDEGAGIEKEDLPHIFERFYKGRKSSETSVGIGLALSLAIVSKQNGILKAENAPEGGARFTLRLYRSVM